MTSGRIRSNMASNSEALALPRSTCTVQTTDRTFAITGVRVSENVNQISAYDFDTMGC
jgi:hypothetical protein